MITGSKGAGIISAVTGIKADSCIFRTLTRIEACFPTVTRTMAHFGIFPTATKIKACFGILSTVTRIEADFGVTNSS